MLRRYIVTCNSIASFTVRIKKLPFATHNVRSTLRGISSSELQTTGFGRTRCAFYCRRSPNLKHAPSSDYQSVIESRNNEKGRRIVRLHL